MTASVTDQTPTLRSRLEGRQRFEPPKGENDTMDVAKRLFTYMVGEENRTRFIIAVVVRVTALVALIVIPFLTGMALNMITSGDSAFGQVSALLLAALLAAAVFMGMSWYAERVFSQLATTGLYKLQCHLFDHMQTLSLSFFDRQPLGELMSRVTNDTEAVSLFYESAVAPLIRSVFQVVMIIVFMLIINWQLTLVALLIVPILLIATGTVQRISTPAFTKLQEELGGLSGFQEETISGHKVIISNRRHEWAEDKSDLLAGSVYDVGTKAFFTSIVQYPLTIAATLLTTILVLVMGAFMYLEGTVSFGIVVAFMSYVALLASPLSDIANLMATTLNAVAGGRRVFTVIDEQPTVVDAPDATDFQFEGGHVEFKDVDFSYVPGRKILKHNTFEAKPGQMIGICGPTGAGKSTIINILTRYYDIDSGTILIDGQDISKLTQASLRQQVGVVLQEAFLFSDTVMANLRYAREDATDDECIEAAKRANAHEFILKLPQGYDTMMTERGSNLSQGQRQMITIARAMVADPKMLILDEATSNVDTRTEKLIQEGLNRLMEGRTSFVIAHRLSTIQPAHNIMVVNAGEIVEFGPHNELMAAKGFYYSLYMSQFKGKGPAGEAGGEVVDWGST